MNLTKLPRRKVKYNKSFLSPPILYAFIILKLFIVDDDKNDAKGISKSESVDKNADDKRTDRRKSDRRNKSDPRNWTRYSMYGGSTRSYGGSREPRVRRTNRGGMPKSSRRDSKYSESDYSDEVSGSGREDKNSRMDREKPR